MLAIIQYIMMVSRIYKTNLYTAYKYNCEQCIDPPCLVKCSGQGGGFVSCSPKYIIKKVFSVLSFHVMSFYSYVLSFYVKFLNVLTFYILSFYILHFDVQ